MKKYIVELQAPEYIENLRHLEKVGKPKSLKSFVIVQTAQSIEQLRAIPGVKLVEEDCMAKASEIPQQLSAQTVQPQPPGWALPWISNTGGSYINANTGDGVDIYILDTGVRDTHTDLAGRVRNLYSFDDVFYSVDEGYEPGHGTAVAACAAGTAYGTAKLATVVNVRSNFLNTDILKCLDVILKDHFDKPFDVPSILNFSGATPLSSIGNAFARLVQYGIPVIAAAGNDSAPTPGYPAASLWCVGVGALSSSNAPAWFTNRKCHVYAPGANIETASVVHDNGMTVTSGTSFASPYYAGLLACQLQGSDKFNTGLLASNFTHFSQMNHNDVGRIPPFDNGGYTVRTVTTRSQPGTYYVNPSRNISDQEIRDFCFANEQNPQIIANAALQYNVDLARFSRVTEYSGQEINLYFIAHGVSPWWFVDGAPIDLDD